MKNHKPQPSRKVPRIAIICDWLTDMGGAERVVLSIKKAFPDSVIFTSVYEPSPLLSEHFNRLDVRTTWLQKFPKFLRRFHTFFPVLRVWAFRGLDLSEFDIIISSSSAESKQVRKTRSDQVHICYCHTPVRYYWDQYEVYKKNPGYGKYLNWLIRLLMPLIIPKMKKLDYEAAQNVDVFIANSSAVRDRIKRYYNKNSTVINPPVDISRFNNDNQERFGYLAGGRQVGYKRYDLAIKACNRLKLPLTVYGGGNQHEYLKSIAGPTISFSHNPSDDEVTRLFTGSQAFIFSALEDFGIVQVEALASGTPVIAYAEGGTRDIVTDNVTGIFFDKQDEDSLIKALEKFQKTTFDRNTLTRHARRFAESMFIDKLRKIVKDYITINKTNI
jgi:glycosyltransferase involved in cell wall biosynthesis